MAISYTDYISRPYAIGTRGRDEFPIQLSTDITIEDNTFNRINIKVDISQDTIEIPCAVLGTIGNILVNRIKFPSLHREDKVLIPLFRNGCSYGYRYRSSTPKEVKSANPLLKELFLDTNGSMVLNWCKCGDTMYYGAPGLILYEDMTPMVMFSLVIKKQANGKYAAMEPIIRVSPKVYTNDDLMSKHIRTKMLCNVMDMREGWRNMLFVYNNNLFVDNSFPALFKVIVNEFRNDWFEVPFIPDVSVTSESIGDFLAKNFTTDDL